jgi:hypothetical protein
MICKKNLFLPLLMICFLLTAGNQFICAKNTNIARYSAIAKGLPDNCSDSAAIEKIITDAIALGAPIYNAGLHVGCYRIYEWAAYKILYEYGSHCKEVEKILKAAIEKSHGDYSDIEKAWLMRAAFDKILGQPTIKGSPEKTDTKAYKG